MNSHTTQKGSVLIVSMLILLVMTLIGVTAMAPALQELSDITGFDGR